MKAGKHGPDCYSNGEKIPAKRRPGQTLALLLCLAAIHPATATEQDSRQVFNRESPQWLRAIGRLQVPGSRYQNGRQAHQLEDCSATLVAAAGKRRANTVITAWHCLEHYRDLSKPISFTVQISSGQTLSREAYRLADGGGMHQDWAILRLYQSIDQQQIAPMRIHPQKADPQRPITMAGFSRDQGLGSLGEQLTYDADCHITVQARDSTDSDCTAYKGASGGAVVQLSDRGKALYAGVISRGDSEGLSIYVPVARFRSALSPHL